ncbi:hypothetical protein TNCV_1925451 [Trichonephila clavipes]|nr:hypothetical protein TNCV_1925451 [Trichonephila clavipes]
MLWKIPQHQNCGWRRTEGFVNTYPTECRYLRSVSRGNWTNSYFNEELANILITQGEAAWWLYQRLTRTHLFHIT